MGCVEDSAVTLGQVDTLKALVMRIKIACEIDKERQAAELEKLQKLLLAEFAKPIKTRSVHLERSMIANNLVYYATTIIFMVVQNHAKILQEHRDFLQQEGRLGELKASLNVLLYCAPLLNKDDLNKFAAVFRRRYPDFPYPSDNQMDELLREFKLRRSVTADQEREYIFTLCNKYSLAVDTINQAGHNYKYA